VSYLQRHHPSSPNAQRLGAHLPGFVESEAEWNSDSTLVNIVRMEWLITEVVFEAYQENLALEKLPTLSPEEFASSSFEVDSTHRMLRTVELIEDLWMARSSESLDFEGLGQDIAKPWLLMRREREGRITFFRLTEGEALLWQHLSSGQKLSEICEDLGDQVELVAEAMPELGNWIQLGLIKNLK